MNCDVALITGKSHRICEDYVRCNSELRHATAKPELLPLLDSKPYVIVADGCSSAIDTDFGARILVKHAENFLTHPHPPNYSASVIHAAYVTSQSMGLDETALDATLLIAQYVEHDEWKGVKVMTYGDGVVAAKKKDGTIEVVSVSFPSGYPFYLSYLLSEQRLKRLIEYTKGNPRRHERLWIKPDGTIDEYRESNEFNGHSPESYMQGMASEYDWFAVFSDGVHSFTINDGTGPQPVHYTEVVKRLTNFKGSMRGEFVQRTMNGFVKETAKLGWSNYDDVSVGVIHMGEVT